MATRTRPPYCGPAGTHGSADSLAGVRVEAVSIDGAWLFTPTQHRDDRGVFLESFTAASLREAVGHDLDLTGILQLEVRGECGARATT